MKKIIHKTVHVLMRDERRKEERSNKAKQHSTPKAVTYMYIHVHTTVMSASMSITS